MVITGANSGLGLETVRELARHGARVVLACRDPRRAESAAEAIRRELPDAQLDLRRLDLSDLDDVARCAEALLRDYPRIDALCNNAGVMALPYRSSPQGFEMQLATNHLGHFALSARLMPALLRADSPRVVTVSSQMHRLGYIDFDDLHGRRRYRAWGAYAQSKLANLVFALELQRRAATGGATLQSMAAHPGYASTSLQTAGPRMRRASLAVRFFDFANRAVAQSAAQGALPQLFALTAPEARGGAYYGPAGLAEMAGPPVEVQASARARDPETARRLWEVSEALTGCRFDVL